MGSLSSLPVPLFKRRNNKRRLLVDLTAREFALIVLSRAASQVLLNQGRAAQACAKKRRSARSTHELPTPPTCCECSHLSTTPPAPIHQPTRLFVVSRSSSVYFYPTFRQIRPAAGLRTACWKYFSIKRWLGSCHPEFSGVISFNFVILRIY